MDPTNSNGDVVQISGDANAKGASRNNEHFRQNTPVKHSGISAAGDNLILESDGMKHVNASTREQKQYPNSSNLPFVPEVPLLGVPNSATMNSFNFNDPIRLKVFGSASVDGSVSELSGIERLPSATFHLGDDWSVADVPPIAFTDIGAMSLSKKLLKLRLYHDKMKNHLEHEMAVYDSLISEEDSIKAKISRQTEILKALSQKAETTTAKCREADNVYRVQRESLRVLQNYVSETSDSLAQESARFNACSTKLMRLRTQQPRVEEELGQLTRRCALLNDGIVQRLEERSKLEDILKRIIDSNTEAAQAVHIVSRESQTTCDFTTVLNEIECMRSELHTQLSSMKKVQDAIHLVRRCT